MTTNAYLVKEGYMNLNKHGSKTVSTMLIICATMLILGIFVIIFQNVNANVKTLRLEQGLQAFIEDKTTDDEVEYMKDELSLIEGVSEVEYMSKAEAFEDAKDQFKDQDYFLDGLENLDIFPASFIVKFENIEDVDNIKAQVEKVEGIYKVKYNASTIEAVISISKVANYFLLGVGSVLLVVSIFIISNTIKLAVYSNKREIMIMRYIGAKNSFIVKPFIVEGAIMGVVSALISFIVISVVYVYTYVALNSSYALGVFKFIPYSSIWYQIFGVYLILGLFIGIFGSAISLKKYLKA